MIFRIVCQVRVPPSNGTLFFFLLSDLVLFVDNAKEKRLSLGEVLNGDRLVSGPFPMEFLRERKSVPVCKKKLSKEDVAKFRAVVHEDYYHQMYFDDLPIWVFLGTVEFDKGQQRYYLFNHILLNIYYNKDRVIEITSRTDTKAMVELTEDKEVDVEFLYTVEWKETDVPFEKRMAKYSQSSSLPRHLDIHRNSVINSCMAVLLLAGFLAAILRILNNDSVK